MGVIRSCWKCGAEKLIGYNRVDGRIKWWTKCDTPGCNGNFMSAPSPRQVESIMRAMGATVKRQES